MTRPTRSILLAAVLAFAACSKDEVSGLGDSGTPGDQDTGAGAGDAGEGDEDAGDTADSGEDPSADAMIEDAARGDGGRFRDGGRGDGGRGDGGRGDGGGRDGGGRGDGGRRDGGRPIPDAGTPDAGPDSGVPLIPLTDMGAQTHQGFSGGLYPSGANDPPAAHAAEGLVRANRIQPRDLTGAPSAMGKIVLLSIGMSNTTQEFCSQPGALPCDAWTFMGQAATSTIINTATLVIANGAMGGRTAPNWDASTDGDYDRVRDSVLTPQGLSEAQVQIAWVKLANARPSVSLPDPAADAFVLEAQLGDVVRSMKIRYPNLEQIFFSSRIYGGYASTLLNPEPYAYETGFSVKWVIEAQIAQEAGGMIDLQAGDLAYAGAPWLAWGPYLWADGTTPRSDGLTWSIGQFENDGTHPARGAEAEVGARLLNFFSSSPYTRCWFVAGGTCP